MPRYYFVIVVCCLALCSCNFPVATPLPPLPTVTTVEVVPSTATKEPVQPQPTMVRPYDFQNICSQAQGGEGKCVEYQFSQIDTSGNWYMLVRFWDLSTGMPIDVTKNESIMYGGDFQTVAISTVQGEQTILLPKSAGLDHDDLAYTLDILSGYHTNGTCGISQRSPDRLLIRYVCDK